MTIPIRVLGGLPGAVIFTALIFLMLAALIGRDQDVPPLDEIPMPDISVLRQLEDGSLAPPREHERPVLNESPPPPIMHDQSFRPTSGALVAPVPDLSADVTVDSGFDINRHAQPEIRVPPQYPTQCSGTAGQAETVVVEFNVTPEGAVVNPEVIQSSNRCFNRAAIRAVQRWKYAPNIVNNEAQARHGVRAALDFVLKGE